MGEWIDYFTAPFTAGAVPGINSASGKDGYDASARGADAAKDKYGNLAKEQRDFQLGGLDKSQGYFNGYNDRLNSMYGRGGGGRGGYEGGYGGMGGGGPVYYNGYGGPPAGSWSGHPVGPDGAVDNSAPSPQFTSTRMPGHVDDPSAPKWGSRGTNTPPGYGAFDAGYSKWQGNLSGPTASGAQYGRMTDQMGGPGATERLNADAKWGPARAGDVYNDARTKFGGPSAAESLYADNQAGFGAPGMHEQFAQSALDGNNPYLDRVEKQGLAQINQQMARRGHFNSGGAMTAIGNYEGELGAQKFKYMGDLTASGQAAQQGRLTGRLGAANASDAGGINRFSAMGNAANAADVADSRDRGQRLDYAQASDTQMGNRNNSLWNASQGLDTLNTNRTLAQANLGMQSEHLGREYDQQMLDNYFRGAQAQSGLNAGAYGTAGAQYGNAMDSSINAGFNAANLRGQGDAARGKFEADALGTAVSMGSGGGGIGGQGGGGGGGGFQVNPAGGGYAYTPYQQQGYGYYQPQQIPSYSLQQSPYLTQPPSQGQWV